MDKDLDAVVVGGAGVDTNVYLHGDDVDWSVESNFSRNVDYVGQAGAFPAACSRSWASGPLIWARSATITTAGSCATRSPATASI